MKDLTVRDVLIEAKRTYLIWDGCDCPIPANPLKETLEKRRRDEQRAVEGGYFHTVANPANSEEPDVRGAGPPKPTSYQPGRKSQQRRQE